VNAACVPIAIAATRLPIEKISLIIDVLPDDMPVLRSVRIMLCRETAFLFNGDAGAAMRAADGEIVWQLLWIS